MDTPVSSGPLGGVLVPQTERLAPCPPVGEEKSVRLSVQTLKRRIIEPGKQIIKVKRK